MTDIVDRAKAALADTTDGPWEVNTEGWACISSGSDSVFHAYVETTCIDCDAEITQSMGCHVAISIEDAEFIAQARTLVPELIAEVERLQAARRDESRYLVETHNDRADLLREVERLRATVYRVRAAVVELESLARKYDANHLSNHARGVAHARRVTLAALDADR